MNTELLIWTAVFVVSLAVLVKASDYFIESAEKIGIYVKIPSFIIGLTIVAMGTSLPETVSSIFAVINNSSEIVIGNVIGSNIANIFLVLGFLVVFSGRLKLDVQQMKVDIMILLISTILLTITILNGVFTLYEGLIFLIFIVAFVIYQVKYKDSPVEDHNEDDREVVCGEICKNAIWILLLSCIFIYFGSDYTIKSVIKLSDLMNIDKEFIAASAIAFGTSLPELAVSISAIKKKFTGILIGNIIGSNIFNIFGTMGVAALFGNLIIPDNVFKVLLPVMLFATFVFILNLLDKKITRFQGALYLLAYSVFIMGIFFI